jgi:hypothetical protein
MYNISVGKLKFADGSTTHALILDEGVGWYCPVFGSWKKDVLTS